MKTLNCKMKTSLVLILTCALVLGALTGCGSKGEKAEETDSFPHHVAVLVHNGQASLPVVDTSTLEESLRGICGEGGSVALITTEGTPQLVLNRTFEEPKVGAGHDPMDSREAKQNLEDIVSAIQETEPSTSEKNLLDALYLASAALQDYDDGDKAIVVLDNGSNTVSPLNMAEAGFQALSSETVDALEKAGYLADLTGTRVDWCYLGQTALPQEPLTRLDQADLEAFWAEYLERCGVDRADLTIHHDMQAAGEQAYAGPTTVTPCPVSDVPANVAAKEKLTQGVELSLAFLPDSDELADPVAAAVLLAPYASVMKETGGNYVLAGSAAMVADISNQDAMEFSLSRAQTVRSLLAEYGVAPQKLQCVGLGHEPHSRRSDDQDHNRVCYVVEADGALANEFLAIGLRG